MNLDVAFAKALKRFRLAQKLTQDDFSLVSSRAYLSILERGKKTPTLGKVGQLAAAMNINPVSLVAYTYLLENKDIDLKTLTSLISKEIKAVELYVKSEKARQMELHAEEFD